jgi:hypothetical protein
MSVDGWYPFYLFTNFARFGKTAHALTARKIAEGGYVYASSELSQVNNRIVGRS